MLDNRCRRSCSRSWSARSIANSYAEGHKIKIWLAPSSPIVAIAHPSTENVTGTDTRLDSNLSHADEWTKVARQLGRTTEDEYFCVPRGRLLLDVDLLTGVILHEPATKSKRLDLIAKRFGLMAWRAERDQHCFTGEEADRLFEER